MLVTTLTTSMAEDLTEYLETNGIKVKYIHHKVETMERTEILRDLRLGVFDVLVGINLLREGLDLPEVSLVAILDADKDGLFRSETALIQTIGRAARNANGQVIMYGDVMTKSMTAAINETNRRRKIQKEYNEKHGIVPRTIIKSVRDLPGDDMPAKSKKKKADTSSARKNTAVLTPQEKEKLIAELTVEMKAAALLLEFERAASLRDEIERIRRS